jgi:hypothetical protein
MCGNLTEKAVFKSYNGYYHLYDVEINGLDKNMRI